MTDKNNTTNLVRWLGFPTNFDYRKWPKLGVITGCALGFTFFAALFISAIQFFSAAFGASNSPTIHADARNYALILAALLSIPFVIWRVLIAQKQADIAEQGLITDRINKAVEQLGAEKTIKYGDHEKTVPNLEVRLGAIYAFERIAQDSLRDHIPIMEILCAYVRHNAPAKNLAEQQEGSGDKKDADKVSDHEHEEKIGPIDIQAILSVIGRRKENHIKFEQETNGNPLERGYRLDLRRTNLQKHDLSSLNFTNAQLNAAELQEAYLCGTNLQGADFSGTKTNRAAVKSTALDEVKNLVEDQLQTMLGDATTILPANMAAPGWAETELDWREFVEKWQAAKAAANL